MTDKVISALTYPADGEIFKLTLDGDAPENDPIEMLRRDGYSAVGWLYNGKKLTGKQTHTFKLVSLTGYGGDFERTLRDVVECGGIPEGQWREALKNAYPHHDSKSKTCVGVADLSWVNQYGFPCFPFIDIYGNSRFHWPAHSFFGRWRWLVVVA